MHNDEFHLLHPHTRHQCDLPRNRPHTLPPIDSPNPQSPPPRHSHIVHITKWSVELHDPLFLGILSTQILNSSIQYPTGILNVLANIHSDQQSDRSSSPGLSFEFVVMDSDCSHSRGKVNDTQFKFK